MVKCLKKSRNLELPVRHCQNKTVMLIYVVSCVSTGTTIWKLPEFSSVPTGTTSNI